MKPILLSFTQGNLDESVPARRVAVQVDWIGILREHEVLGTVLSLAYVGELWVRESLPEVVAAMSTELYQRECEINAAAWNGKVNKRG